MTYLVIAYLSQQLIVSKSQHYTVEKKTVALDHGGERIHSYSSRTTANGKDLLHRVKCQSCGLIRESMTHRLE